MVRERRYTCNKGKVIEIHRRLLWHCCVVGCISARIVLTNISTVPSAGPLPVRDSQTNYTANSTQVVGSITSKTVLTQTSAPTHPPARSWDIQVHILYYRLICIDSKKSFFHLVPLWSKLPRCSCVFSKNFAHIAVVGETHSIRALQFAPDPIYKRGSICTQNLRRLKHEISFGKIFALASLPCGDGQWE